MDNINKLKNRILRTSIGMIYFVFGILKFFPALSPAEELAKNTIHVLTFGILPSNLALTLLALIETGIGILLLTNWQKSATLNIAIAHIILTFSPFFIFPDLIFGNGEFALTLVGQYIFKNFIILSALVNLKIDFLPTSKLTLKKQILEKFIDIGHLNRHRKENKKVPSPAYKHH